MEAAALLAFARYAGSHYLAHAVAVERRDPEGSSISCARFRSTAPTENAALENIFSGRIPMDVMVLAKQARLTSTYERRGLEILHDGHWSRMLPCVDAGSPTRDLFRAEMIARPR